MAQGGRYVLCDRCEKAYFTLNLPWPHDGKTLSAAREAGWRCIREPEVNFEEDVCPSCIELEGGIRPVEKPIAGHKLSPMETYQALMSLCDVVLPRHRR